MSITDGTTADQTELRELYKTIPVTYLVYKSSSNYYAKTTVAGGTDYGPSTNASTIIQNAWDAMGDEGLLYIQGIIDCDTTLNFDIDNHPYCDVFFEHLRFTADTKGIYVNGNETMWNGKLLGNRLRGFTAGYASTLVQLEGVFNGNVKIGFIGGSTSSATASIGVELLGSTNKETYYNTVEVTYMYDIGIGVQIKSTGTGYSNHNTIQNTCISTATTGFNFSNLGVNTGGNTLHNCRVDGVGGVAAITGFSNTDENYFIGCQTLDMPVGGTDFYNAAGGIARLIDCKWGGSTVTNLGTLLNSSFQVKPAASLDLSGAATDIVAWHAPNNALLLGYTVLYTEASSADAGVSVDVGRYQDGVGLDDDYFDTSTSEQSKNLGYSKTFLSADLTNAEISSGDTVTVGTAGGKVGTGEVLVLLDVAYV